MEAPSADAREGRLMRPNGTGCNVRELLFVTLPPDVDDIAMTVY